MSSENGIFLTPREIAQRGLLGGTLLIGGIVGVGRATQAHHAVTDELDRRFAVTPVTKLTDVLSAASYAAKYITLIPADYTNPAHPVEEQLVKPALTKEKLADVSAELRDLQYKDLAKESEDINITIPDIEQADQPFNTQQKGIRNLLKGIKKARDEAKTKFNNDPKVRELKRDQKIDLGAIIGSIGVALTGGFITKRTIRQARNNKLPQPTVISPSVEYNPFY